MLLEPPPFKYRSPRKISAPILVSSPHSGTSFPETERTIFKSEVLNHPLDTDWYVDRLYEFTLSLGLPMISAEYSRYVIDLNRPTQSQSLYNDGRKETGLYPINSFLGSSLYVDGFTPSDELKNIRMRTIYQPYYNKVETTLRELKEEFGYALLFDAHSIKSRVSTIQSNKFPHFILGTNDGLSCPQKISDVFLKHLLSWKGLEVSENFPFKGGNITRHFGALEPKIWAIQLEMSQDLYLDESNDSIKEKEFNTLASFLRAGFEKLMGISIE